ncbi:MAG: InlB B-repeat-containing protein [Oscillospiraceae bacterium]|nr:InlB B-repeat-containing protein [Oscillospiraceae bacterium]
MDGKGKFKKGLRRLVTLLIVLSFIMSTMGSAFAGNFGESDAHEGLGYLPIVPLSPFYVTFEANGGTHIAGWDPPNNSIPNTGPGGTVANMVPAPTPPTGLTFRQWNTAQNGSGSVFTGDTPVTDDMSVYAQWAALMTFHLNGGEGTAPGSFFISPGNSVDTEPGISWPNDPTQLGHNFEGWFTSAIGGTEIFSNTPINANTPVFAQWTPIENFTVTFNPAPGNPADAQMTRQAFAGLSIAASWPALNNLPAPDFGRSAPLATLPGRTLHSWWTLEGGMDTLGSTFFALPRTGAIQFNHALLPVNSNMTVFPQWVARVSFNANGGSNAPNGYYRDILPSVINNNGFGTVDADGVGSVGGNSVTNPPWPGWDGTWPSSADGMPPDPSRTGHQFIGWVSAPPAPWMPPVLAPGTTTPGNLPAGFTPFFGDTPVENSMTVWALWQENPPLTIRFNAEGGTWPVGTNDPVTVDVAEGGSIQSTTGAVMPPIPSMDGHVFMGWYFVPDFPITTNVRPAMGTGTTPDANDSLRAYRTVHSDMIGDNGFVNVYALWLPSAMVTFNQGGGDFEPILDPTTTPADMEPVRYVPTSGWTFHILNQVIQTFTPPLPVTDPNFGGRFFTGNDRFNLQGNDPPAGSPFQFLGWNTDYYGNGIRFRLTNPGAMPITDAVLVDDVLDLYAMWAPRVRFHSNWEYAKSGAGDGGNPPFIDYFIAYGRNFGNHHLHPNIGVLVGATWTQIPPLEFPGPDNWPGGFPLPEHAFVGWNTAPDGTGDWFEYDDNVYEVTSVFAIWSSDIVFRPGIAPPGVILAGNETRPVPYPAGPLVNMPPDPIWIDTVTGDERTFLGWYGNPDGTGVHLTPILTITGAYTFYATWAVTVIFDANGGIFAPGGTTSVDGSERYFVNPYFIGGTGSWRNLPQTQWLVQPTRQNWTLVTGDIWNSTQYAFDPVTNLPLAAGVIYPEDGEVIDWNIRLYARWEGVVTFDPNGGTFGVSGPTTTDPRTLSEYATITTMMPSTTMPDNPVRDGYTFIGWFWVEEDVYVDGDYVDVINRFDADTPMTMGDVTVFAQWLEIEKAVDRTFATVENTITYTITVTNDGAFDLEDVLVTDIISSHLAFVPADLPEHDLGNVTITHSAGGTTSYGIASQSLTVMIAELAVGDTVVITFQVAVLAGALGQTIPNYATVSGIAPGNNGSWSGNTNIVTTVVPNVPVIKTVSQYLAEAGDTLTYTITITNNGTDALTDVVITDAISQLLIVDETTITSDVGTPVFNTATNTLTLTIPNFDVGASITITFEAEVDSAALGHYIPNFARVTSDAWDGGYIDSNSVVTDVPNIVFEKSVDLSVARVGDILTYTITVTNRGPHDLTNLTVTDVLHAAWLAFVENSVLIAPAGTATYGFNLATSTLTVNIPLLGVGEAVEITFQAVVQSAAAGNEIENIAIIDGPGLPEGGVESDPVEVEVAPPGGGYVVVPPGGGWTPSPTPPPTPPMFPTRPAELSRPAVRHHAYLIGFEDGTIRPRANVSRAQVATIFFRLMSDGSRANYWMQTNPYPDVVLEQWFNNAVSTTTNAGMFIGMPDGTFHPDRAITRAELAAVIARMIGVTYNGEPLFNDIAGHWAEGYINAAARNGWVIGYEGLGGRFMPNQPITRAEAAAMINRVFERLPETPDDLLDGMLTWPDNANPNAWYYLYIQEATNSHYYEMKADGAHETWIQLIPPRPWHLLERPESVPEDIFRIQS